MGHLYADLGEFKNFLSGGDPGDDRNAAMLVVLESASRAVDAYCRRGNGFGPEILTKAYRGTGQTLHLQADLIDAIEVRRDDVVTTDYEVTDARTLTGSFGFAPRIEVDGSFGYWDAHDEVAALAVAMSSTTPVAEVDDATDIQIGDTLLVDDEQMLVTDTDGTSLTVRRGANGTTAEAHDYAAAVDAYRYPAEVVDATLRVAQRRWKARDGGVTQWSGEGPGLPGTANMDTEASILRMSVGHLRYFVVF